MAKKNKRVKKPVFDIGDTQNKPVFEPIKEARFNWAFDRNFCDLSNSVYGWHKATPEMLFFSAITKLKEYESSSWMNMPAGARFHSVPWDKLSDNVKKRLSTYVDKGCTLCQIA